MANESVAVAWFQPGSGRESLFSTRPEADREAARGIAADLRLSVSQTLDAAAERGDGLDAGATFLCRFALEAAEALASAGRE